MKLSLGILFLLVGLLLLLIYPFVFLANVMSLGGNGNGTVPFAAWAFFYGSLAYPLVYIPCAVAWFILRRRERADAALRASGIPLFYALTLAVLFAKWFGAHH